jgi:hypothetical protein
MSNIPSTSQNSHQYTAPDSISCLKNQENKPKNYMHLIHIHIYTIIMNKSSDVLDSHCCKSRLLRTRPMGCLSQIMS